MVDRSKVGTTGRPIGTMSLARFIRF